MSDARPEAAGAAIPMASFERPSRGTLREGIAAVLGVAATEIVVVDRGDGAASTYPTERVTCRLADGRTVSLFCKYTGGYNDLIQDHERYGHRGGVQYEAEVFRHALQGLPVTVPRLYGTHRSEAPPNLWLILEWIDEAVPLTWLTRSDGLAIAGRWLGHFHALTESRLPRLEDEGIVRRYDAAYYLGWARRTERFSRSWHAEHPWLATACRKFEDVLAFLLEGPLTMIHGEFYGKNVVLRGDTLYVFDWESAAIGAGEIDLASITEAWWRPNEVRAAEDAYRSARWPSGAPPHFAERLAASRLYCGFRWLGDNARWTAHSGPLIQRLEPVAAELGLI